MIPTVLLPALLVGRWWLVPAAALAWPLALLIDGACAEWPCAAGGAVAAANAAAGVAVHRAAAALRRAVTAA